MTVEMTNYIVIFQIVVVKQKGVAANFKITVGHLSAITKPCRITFVLIVSTHNVVFSIFLSFH